MLPKIDLPVYETTLPISKISVKFRPFLVKEQKILLIAMESEDSKFANDNVKQILNNCCMTELNVDSLSSVDIEYLFLQLRARSIGEIVETKYRCRNNNSEGEECGNLMPVNINLLEVSIKENSFSDVVQLTEKVGIKLKYPDLSTIEKLQNKEGSVISKTFDAVLNCIDYIFDDNNFYYPKEISKKELEDFVESLNVDQFNKIADYFKNLPKLREEIDIKCSKCGYEHKIVLEGLQNFLG